MWSQGALLELMDSKSTQKLDTMGGFQGLAAGLGTNLTSGISCIDAPRRKAKYGVNKIVWTSSPDLVLLMSKVWRDVKFVLLFVAGLVSLTVGMQCCAVGLGLPCPRKPYWAGPIHVLYSWTCQWPHAWTGCKAQQQWRAVCCFASWRFWSTSSRTASYAPCSRGGRTGQSP